MVINQSNYYTSIQQIIVVVVVVVVKQQQQFTAINSLQINKIRNNSFILFKLKQQQQQKPEKYILLQEQ